MHVLGLHGMPRRVYTYPAAMGWGTLNLLASVGAAADGVRRRALPRRRGAGAARRAPSPATTRGAPARSSGRPARRRRTAISCRPPTVAGRDPLWDNPPDQPVVVGLRDRRARCAGDARARRRARSPRRVSGPVDLAVPDRASRRRRCSSGRSSRRGAWSTARVPVFVTMVGWFWPKRAGRRRHAAVADPHRTLPQPNEAPARPEAR